MMSSLIILAAATAPPNPEWNCADPMAQQELNWCAHQDFLAADAALNEQWKQTAAAMKQRDADFVPMEWDDRPGYFATLLEAQRAHGSPFVTRIAAAKAITRAVARWNPCWYRHARQN